MFSVVIHAHLAVVRRNVTPVNILESAYPQCIMILGGVKPIINENWLYMLNKTFSFTFEGFNINITETL